MLRRGDVATTPDGQALLAQMRDEILTIGWTHPHFLPFFAEMRFVETTAIPTMAVDYLGNIYVNVAWARTLTPRYRVGVCMHETLHPLLCHDARRDGREPVRWNRAGDRAINQFLRLCGIGLPPDALYPGAGQEDWTAEQFYETEPEPPTVTIIVPTAGCGMIEPQPGAPGTGVHGDPERHPGVTVSVDGAGNLQITVDEETAQELVRRLGDAAVQARLLAQGTEAGAALAQLVEPPEPRVDWTTILRNGLGEAAATADREDVTWSRRSRRSGVDGAQLPGWQAFQVRAAVVIDTSGSMSDEDVAEAVGHTVAIGLATKSKLFLVVHDAVVQWAGWLEGDLAPQLPAKMLGRGGTAFEPAYARIAEEHAQFDIMIHLTDGGVGTWPARPPNVQRGIVALLGWMDRHALPPDQEAIDAKL